MFDCNNSLLTPKNHWLYRRNGASSNNSVPNKFRSVQFCYSAGLMDPRHLSMSSANLFNFSYVPK